MKEVTELNLTDVYVGLFFILAEMLLKLKCLIVYIKTIY
jgi:hypothetical protein